MKVFICWLVIILSIWFVIAKLTPVNAADTYTIVVGRVSGIPIPTPSYDPNAAPFSTKIANQQVRNDLEERLSKIVDTFCMIDNKGYKKAMAFYQLKLNTTPCKNP